MIPLRLPFRHEFSVALVLTVCLILSTASRATAAPPRVTHAYTAWDDYFFYAGFQVDDHRVFSVNKTPVSQPQQDDDVEVFFDTDPQAKSAVRTDKTYQMAVSAGGGAYFSVGDRSGVPRPKLVLTYKYAMSVDGTLNDPSGTATGYTIEIAIPWQELGQTGPPAEGTTWGFNAISRDRESADQPAASFVSLSPSVRDASSVQVPADWAQIQFVNGIDKQASGNDMVFCPHVTDRFPVIDGVIRSGEWNPAFGLSFGGTRIAADAPTRAQEPNVSQSPFASLPPDQQTVPVTVVPPMPPTPETPSTPDYTLTLPGGGSVHVGKAPTAPPVVVPETQAPQPEPRRRRRHGQVETAQLPPSNGNPLTPALPIAPQTTGTVGPEIDPNATLALVPQEGYTPLIVAPYVYAYGSSASLISALHDQPMDGLGPAFGGHSAQWNREQLRDARRAGIDVALPVFDPADPNAVTGLDVIVEALQEMRAAGEDYPLLGVKIAGDAPQHAVEAFFKRVPQEFRAQVTLPDKEDNQPAYLVVADTLPDTAALKSAFAQDFDDRATLLITTPDGKEGLTIRTVSPGGIDADGKLIGRSREQTYGGSWQSVYDNRPNWVYVDSWNDYKHGTEIAASRQYGEQYADLTRIASLQWYGGRQWNAKYLQAFCPQTFAPKTIYTVPIRIENNGTLPWRVGENYSLCYRWYKDGRLSDDSAPRIPLSTDVYPGQSATVNVGVLAQNSFGQPIEPGDYTLVFDMVQGQDRWFTYVGDEPLKVHVRVVSAEDAPKAKAVILAASLPSVIGSTGSAQIAVEARNEGQQMWQPDTTSLVVDGGSGHLAAPVAPGAIGTFTGSMMVTPSAHPEADYTITVKTPDATASLTVLAVTVPNDLGASFTISDVQRTVRTGDTLSAKIGVANTGALPWAKGKSVVGYRWYYLDGTPALDGETTKAFNATVPPLTESALTLGVKAPLYPGRYQLVFDLQTSDGQTTFDLTATRGRPFLPIFVSVVPGEKSLTVPIDLTNVFDTSGIGFETESNLIDFDGLGNAIPGEMLPPDGTAETDANPLLLGRPGPPDYPSGYYSEVAGTDAESNHRIAFRFPPKGGNDAVTCNGQGIALPDGKYRAVHLLMAATGGSSVTDSFTIVYGDKDGPVSQPVTVADWGTAPARGTATVGFQCNYRLNKGVADASKPCILGDYPLETDVSKRLARLILPKDPNVKILAVTVEK